MNFFKKFKLKIREILTNYFSKKKNIKITIIYINISKKLILLLIIFVVDILKKGDSKNEFVKKIKVKNY